MQAEQSARARNGAIAFLGVIAESLKRKAREMMERQKYNREIFLARRRV